MLGSLFILLIWVSKLALLESLRGRFAEIGDISAAETSLSLLADAAGAKLLETLGFSGFGFSTGVLEADRGDSVKNALSPDVLLLSGRGVRTESGSLSVKDEVREFFEPFGVVFC